MDYVRRAVWGMLYADDACIVLRSPRGLAKIMEVISEVCRAFALTNVFENKPETMHASTAYTAHDDASRSGSTKLQIGAILHLPGGSRYRNPGHVH